jgi:hypothetical protein
MVLGIVLARAFKILRDEESEKVILKLDWIGGIILVVFIAVRLSGDWIF